MKLASWNVNGLRACEGKGFLNVVCSDIDFLGIQELRSLESDLSDALKKPLGVQTTFFPAQKKGYSGVAVYSKLPFTLVQNGMGIDRFDVEGRVVWVKLGKLHVFNVYFPNGAGKDGDNARVPYKLDFYDSLRALVRPLVENGERVLVIGDWNTAYTELDLSNPKQNQKTSGFLPEERESMGKWFKEGWVDTFRHYYPNDAQKYSWWSFRQNSRARNVGWRIDCIFASPAVLPFLKKAWIASEIMGSDHCPVMVELDNAILG
jgi:exodeoxyribonuclease-3